MNEVDVEYEDKFFPWFGVFDYETLLTSVDTKHGEKIQWCPEHVPVSISASSNLSGYDKAKFFVNENPNFLLGIKEIIFLKYAWKQRDSYSRNGKLYLNVCRKSF